MLGLKFPCLRLSLMDFSTDFFCSTAQLLLSGLSLLHPDLRKENLPHSQIPVLKLVPQKLLARYEVLGTYKVESISRYIDKL